MGDDRCSDAVGDQTVGDLSSEFEVAFDWTKITHQLAE
jgi:hypothetical protein